MMKRFLFDPAVLDQLEGLNERYVKLGARIEELETRINGSSVYACHPIQGGSAHW